MQIGTVVWFSDHPRPFLVNEKHCTNVGCTCSDIWLTLREFSEDGAEVTQPQTLKLCVDVENWKERDPIERSAQDAQRIQQFLAGYPRGLREDMKRRILEFHQRASRIAAYVMDPEDVTDGILFPYSKLVTDPGSRSEGRPEFQYSFFHQDTQYLIEDSYCPNPKCDCQKVTLCFNKERVEIRQGIETHIIAPAFIADIALDGTQKPVVHPADSKTSLAVGKSVISSWWTQFRGGLPEWRSRYRLVKEVGQHTLDHTAKREARVAPQLPLEPRLNSEPRRLAPEIAPMRVGRNMLCPCGSGIKYKRCCGRQE